MANNDLNTDQDINNTPPNQPDEYATRYRGGSNPDLDVAGSAPRGNQGNQGGQQPMPADTSLGGAGLSQDAYATQVGNPNAMGDTAQTGSTSPNIPGEASGTLGNTERPGPGGSGDRLGSLGGGTPGLAGQTTNMDDAGPIERGDIAGQPRDEERTGNDDRNLSGSTGHIGATAYGTYNEPNERTGPSNSSTGGGFDNASTTDADTPVMRRGGDLGGTDIMSGDGEASTDVVSGDQQTGAGVDQVPRARTDTTLDEDYSTGPRTSDPE